VQPLLALSPGEEIPLFGIRSRDEGGGIKNVATGTGRLFHLLVRHDILTRLIFALTL
jgi:hypothetical protein